MTNRYLPHLLVLPEDKANRQIINGFLLEGAIEKVNKVQVLPEAGGWTAVIDRFCHDEVGAMQNYPQRFIVLVLDFDNDPERLDKIKGRIPGNLLERVFVLGVLSEPEELKPKLGLHFEEIGKAMARDCQLGGDGIWNDKLLVHNAEELERIKDAGLHELLF
jgi:hypothetical protein